MVPQSQTRQRSYKLIAPLAIALLTASGFVAAVLAQQLPQPRPADGAQPELPQLPQKGPLPADDLRAFVKDVGTNDAFFEVPLGQGRILTTKVDLGGVGKGGATDHIAAGDPAGIEFSVLNKRQIRVIGLQVGVTDLAITTKEGESYSFEVRVTADLNPLRAQLLKAFPDARVRLSQMRDHVVVEGQARDGAQVTRIMETISAYLDSILAMQERRITQTAVKGPEAKGIGKKDEQPPPPVGPLAPGLKIDSKITQPKIVNLLRVPGAQQVLLKVKVAELDRTAFRQIGADLIAGSKQNGAIFGTNASGLGPRPTLKGTNAGLVGLTEVFAGGPTTVFGIFENADFAFFLSALRRNELLRILAEPNLVALNGHQATFLAGGEFPIPVPQSGAGGGPATITIQFKKFGVSLAFKPDILDGDRIRMSVDPEVSSIDFAIGTAISGTVVPGLNTRNAHTVVEMKEGQTLAMAGLLSVTLEGTTNRIPGLGDVPVLGPLFSNTTNKRQEKELIVLVTPYLVDALNCDQVPPSPGAEVGTPNDLEFYVGNRIESKTGRDWRATTGNYAAPPVPVPAFLKLHTDYIRGPHGFVD